jgi:acetyl esterase/lipase
MEFEALRAQFATTVGHRKVVGHIAKAKGAIAINVDYRLKPEHRHPAQAEDSLAVYRTRRHLFGGPVGDRRRFGRWQIGA